MTVYEVYATRWDDPRVVSELIPARDVEFSLPLSDHGEASFTATVEPGWSSWRAEITKDLSGVLIARDGHPEWQGWVVEDRQVGPRTFTFRALEWGWFFSSCPAPVSSYQAVNDGEIFRDLVDRAQAVAGQDVQVVTGSDLTSKASDLTIRAWDDSTVEQELRALATPSGGPEWYVGTTGGLTAPVRRLYLGDRLGTVDPAVTLEYVEDTAPADRPGAPPLVALLGDLFPGPAPLVPTRRAGGNVVAVARTRQGESATVAVATGAGAEAARLTSSATSSLLGRGWPRMTRTRAYSNVSVPATLAGHAAADLRAAQGFATGYALVTLDGDPDWTRVPRGSTVQVVLDTDVYAGPRPLEVTTRVFGVTVRVPVSGRAQVQWDVATVQEV